MIGQLFSRLFRSQPHEPTIYLHFPCFDGLISASVAWDFLESSQGWKISRFCPVNYDELNGWLDKPIAAHSAVVDFLYHPNALLWADHHPTTFVNDEARIDFESRSAGRFLFYDKNSPSCASVLWKHLESYSTDRVRYGEMVYWADRIDSADYASVAEAVMGSSPAMEINLSLIDGKNESYCKFLLRRLRTMALSEVASLREVQQKVLAVRERTKAGLEQVKQTIRLLPGEIAVFEADETKRSVINRYSPYWFLPEARYSIGLVHTSGAPKITAMRNPWLNFESIELGKLFAKYGGGGHRRVASLILRGENAQYAKETLNRIVLEVERQDNYQATTAKRAYA